MTNHHQIYLYQIYFHGYINLEFDFLFRERVALSFFDSACFIKFSPIKKQFDTPKHHNPGLLPFYEIISIDNFEILSSRKFETRHFTNDFEKFLRVLIFRKKPFKFHGFFLRGMHFRKYVNFARRENKKVSRLSFRGI